MKIGGKKIDAKPASDFIVFPRESGDIALRANAIMDRTEFDKLVPMPRPPKKMIKGGIKVDNPDDPKHITSIHQYSVKFVDWLVINSLCGIDLETKEDTPIEWEIVDRLDPKTWNKWDEELKQSGFSDMERKRINNLVTSVNSLSEGRLDEARNSFLQQVDKDQEISSSPSIEQSDTPSGEPASGSE